MDAEKEKMRSELEHHRKSLAYQDLENRVHKLEKTQKRNIATAKPYYDLKTQLEVQLEVGYKLHKYISNQNELDSSIKHFVVTLPQVYELRTGTGYNTAWRVLLNTITGS